MYWLNRLSLLSPANDEWYSEIWDMRYFLRQLSYLIPLHPYLAQGSEASVIRCSSSRSRQFISNYFENQTVLIMFKAKMPKHVCYNSPNVSYIKTLSWVYLSLINCLIIPKRVNLLALSDWLCTFRVSLFWVELCFPMLRWNAYMSSVWGVNGSWVSAEPVTIVIIFQRAWGHGTPACSLLSRSLIVPAETNQKLYRLSGREPHTKATSFSLFCLISLTELGIFTNQNKSTSESFYYDMKTLEEGDTRSVSHFQRLTHALVWDCPLVGGICN